MISVKDKKTTVLGAARSGIAAARLLMKHEARVFVSDLAPLDQKLNQAEELRKWGIEFEFGGHSDRVLDADFAVLSPGIPVESQIVSRVLEKGIPVYSEIEIASWFCKTPVIAVTGSNGKTTTTTLIGEMLKSRYPDAIVAGNIGQPFSEYVDHSAGAGWVVVEVSSFQLETIKDFHPSIVIVLNFAPNHLDRYRSYEDYIRAKWRITSNLGPEDLLIYNGNDVQLSDWAMGVECRRKCFRLEIEDNRGAFFHQGVIYVDAKEFIPVSEMILKGKHNYMNAMAAILAAEEAGVNPDAIKEVLRTFKGVEHRMEFVRDWNGIRFFNDSKATTIESLYYALQSFTEPVILIAGGKDKGSDFSRLNDLVKKHVYQLILIGVDAPKIEEAWKKLVPVHHGSSMEDAVEQAASLARKGDVVLLSPACASFDMFKDFEDRGRQFKQQVQKLT